MKLIHTKLGMNSSKGFCALITPNNESICFRSDRCSQIKGLDGTLWEWLGNKLRTFTPTEITISRKLIHANFTLEKISFTAERVSEEEFRKEFDKEWFEGLKIINQESELKVKNNK